MVDQNDLQKHADGLAKRAKAILTEPDKTWDEVAKETDPPMQVFLRYAVPLAAIGPIAGLIGSQIFPISVMGVSIKLSIGAALTATVVGYIFALLAVWILAFIANLLSQQFEGRDDYPAAFRLVAYSLTAGWIAGILQILGPRSFMFLLIFLAGLYGFYLFYKGAPKVMGVAEEKAAVYTVLVVVAAFVTFAVIGTINAQFATPSIGDVEFSVGNTDILESRPS